MKEILIQDIARVCHEANRAICQAFDDDSQVAWEDAPKWQKDSAIDGVRFHLDNPDAGPEAQHDAWMEHKIATGWVHGRVKDPIAQTHPCLVPFHQLPPDQQVKTYVFRAVVLSMSTIPGCRPQHEHHGETPW